MTSWWSTVKLRGRGFIYYKILSPLAYVSILAKYISSFTRHIRWKRLAYKLILMFKTLDDCLSWMNWYADQVMTGQKVENFDESWWTKGMRDSYLNPGKVPSGKISNFPISIDFLKRIRYRLNFWNHLISS